MPTVDGLLIASRGQQGVCLGATGRSSVTPAAVRRLVIRATHERGLGVPPSRSLATASHEASESLSEATGGACVTVHATTRITRSPIPETSTADLRAAIRLQIGGELRKT